MIRQHKNPFPRAELLLMIITAFGIGYYYRSSVVVFTLLLLVFLSAFYGFFMRWP